MREQEINWVQAAIAEQEEHIKRVSSCMGTLGRSHAFRPHGRPGTAGVVMRCVVCGVTGSREDYERLHSKD